MKFPKIADMSSENIITFGSCLSRYVARSYKRLYAGEIVSSIYHNRSDYFVNSLLDNTNSAVKIGAFETLIEKKECVDADEDIRNIVLNQTVAGVGLHKIDGTQNLFDMLNHTKIDMIIVDNFMDISGRLSSGLGLNCFLRPNDYKNYHEHFVLGGYISAENSAKYFSRILDFFLEKAPHAKIFFLHFPWNTYADKRRKSRSVTFASQFRDTRAIIVPPQSIPKIYRTKVSSHFREPQYTAYAGMIRAFRAM